VAYNIKPTNTVLRISYARVLETPFNENLIVGVWVTQEESSPACWERLDRFAAASETNSTRISASFRAPRSGRCRLPVEVHAQRFRLRRFVQHTHHLPDLLAQSKISGFSVRTSVPNFHGLTAFVTMSGVNSRFFNPQVAGLGTDFTTLGAFRIDTIRSSSRQPIFNISQRNNCRGLR